MANPAPGVNVNIVSAASNPSNQASTSTWFALGMAAGPAGVAVPIRSTNDFTNYFGRIVSGGLTGRYTINAQVSSTMLYDSLDVFFREGGSMAWVSRVNAATSVAAASTPGILAGDGGNIQLNALGGGTWANSSSSSAAGLILTINGYTVGAATVYGATIAYNGVIMASASGLGSDADVVTWVNSLPSYQAMCTATLLTATTILPASGASASIYLVGGTDIAVADTDTPAALAVFTDLFGPGQISYPGNTSEVTYQDLTNHGAQFNRVAILDAVNTATAATLETAASTTQTTVADPSYGALFGPWLIVPGIVNSNPAIPTSTVFNRIVPPSALVAAKMCVMDATNDANVPAAGTLNGASSYAIGVTQVYSNADRGALDAAGVNVIRMVPGINVVAIYGYTSLSFSQGWKSLGNVRMRMQITRDLDAIGETFIFQEIDGKGHLLAAFAGALSGQLNAYWLRGSLYGLTAGQAFSVNTGPAVNTPATIAAGQLNASVSLKMSPYAEFVTINITKYMPNVPLPA